MKGMRAAKGTRSIEVVKAIPAYPDEISVKDIAKKLKKGTDHVYHVILSFPALMPVCQDGSNLCFASLEDKRRTLRAMRQRSTKNDGYDA